MQRGFQRGRLADPPAGWVALAVIVLVPLVWVAESSFRPAEGVVIEDTRARLGPGYAYDPAFEQPLHRAAEFSWIETSSGWVRARLPDGSEGWLRASESPELRGLSRDPSPDILTLALG